MGPNREETDDDGVRARTGLEVMCLRVLARESATWLDSEPPVTGEVNVAARPVDPDGELSVRRPLGVRGVNVWTDAMDDRGEDAAEEGEGES